MSDAEWLHERLMAMSIVALPTGVGDSYTISGESLSWLVFNATATNDKSKKAAILDELIDQAATYCAVRASDDDFDISHQDCRGLISDFAELLASKVWFAVIHTEGDTARVEAWAEAEARLRNGECWDLLIGGGE